ncbi:MAG TPA: CoA transferase [Acidimicrobiales bacterium]|jgi:crotonobetainyl-CoA:carnitine CoA-transferase CaiB-like acyl-CoA transferase|nr:CoA transferase [Acidimicrobiales bacterium]
MTTDPVASGPLDGVRVLDLTSVVMGPYGTQILGDLGADVITIEPPLGEANRAMGPGPTPQLSGVALNLLRNKRNVSLNFKTPAGRDALLAIAATCDVFVTNLRPGPLARAGISYEDVAAVRPDIIYCQAHGYPSDGPRANESAYDDVVQTETGIADATSRLTGRPMLAATILADKVCGLTIVYSVTAALYRRSVTGLGDRIEIPMAETVSAFTLVEHGAGAIPEPALGPAGYLRVLNEERGPWPTTDGWIMALPYTHEHYDSIFRATGRTDLVGDQRYATAHARITNSPWLYHQVGSMMAGRTTAEWLAFFREHDVPAAPVATLADLVAGLPIGHHPVAGAYRQIPPAVRFDRSPQAIRRPAPLIGEHTDEVLAEAGYQPGGIDELRRSGVVGTVPGEFA